MNMNKQITNEFFDLIIEQKLFNEDYDDEYNEPYAYLQEEALNELFNQYLNEIDYWSESASEEARREYESGGF